MWKLVLIPFWLAWFKYSCYMWPYCDVVGPCLLQPPRLCPTLPLAPAKLLAHPQPSPLRGWCVVLGFLQILMECLGGVRAEHVSKSRVCQSTGKTRSTSEPQVLLWKLKRGTLGHQHCVELYGKIPGFPPAHWTTVCYKDWLRERYMLWSQTSPGKEISWFSAWYGSVWLSSYRGSKEQDLVKILAALSMCAPSQSHSVQVSFT